MDTGAGIPKDVSSDGRLGRVWVIGADWTGSDGGRETI